MKLLSRCFEQGLEGGEGERSGPWAAPRPGNSFVKGLAAGVGMEGERMGEAKQPVQEGWPPVAAGGRGCPCGLAPAAVWRAGVQPRARCVPRLISHTASSLPSHR